MKDAKHPIWTLLNRVALLGFVLLFSYLNASRFDQTELKMLLEVALGVGGLEAVAATVRRFKGEPVEEKEG
jgi:hypothetical protein